MSVGTNRRATMTGKSRPRFNQVWVAFLKGQGTQEEWQNAGVGKWYDQRDALDEMKGDFKKFYRLMWKMSK